VRRHLILCADDYTADAGRNRGIEMAAAAGAINCVGVLGTGRSRGGLSSRIAIGVHIDLSDGPFLTDWRPVRAGRWGDKRDAWIEGVSGTWPLDRLRAEVDAQIMHVARLTRRPLSHLDAHNHLHVAHPGITRVFLEAAVAHGIPRVRWPVEPMVPEDLDELARLDLTRGVCSATLQRLCRPASAQELLPEAIRWMRRSALADALVYRSAAAGRDAPAASLPFAGTAFGHRPSVRKLLTIEARAAASPPTEVMVHPGFHLRGRGFAGPGRTRELAVLLTFSLVRRVPLQCCAQEST
jgi:hypothetical protein